MTATPRRAAVSEAAILQATVQLLADRGFGGLTMEGVAAAAGVGKPTIYRWWPSKGALAIDALLAAAQPNIQVTSSGDLSGDLVDLLDQVRNLLGDPALGRHFVACLMHSQTDPHLAARFSQQVFGPVRGSYRARLQAACEAGQLSSSVGADVLLDMAFGALWLRAATRPAELTDPGLARDIVNVLLGGAATTKPPPRSTNGTAATTRPRKRSRTTGGHR